MICGQSCQVVVVLLALGASYIVEVEGCYFLSCPVGGKRSSAGSSSNTGMNHQCQPCGPNGQGQCFGPQICCHSSGCVVGQLASECEKENESTTPCLVTGKSCGSEGQGHCGAHGICCDNEACSANSHCKESAEVVPYNRQELLALLKRIIKRVEN